MQGWMRDDRGARRAGAVAHAAASWLASVCLGSAAALDLAGVAADALRLWVAGAHVATAGLVAGLIGVLTAVPAHVGLASRSRERRRSLRHGALTLFALALFALARWVRGHPEVPPDPPIVGAEAVAALLLATAVVMGRRLRSVAAPAEGTSAASATAD